MFLPSCYSSFCSTAMETNRVRANTIVLLLVLAALVLAAALFGAGDEVGAWLLQRLRAAQILLAELLVAAHRQQPALVLVLTALLVVPAIALVSLTARLVRRAWAWRAQRGQSPRTEWTRDCRPRAGVPAWPASAWLELDGQGRAVPLKAEVTSIGRHQDNVLHLEHASVHRYHAVIHRNDDAHFVITDLSGVEGNGVRINGERKSCAHLADGDRIELGAARLTFAAVPH